MGLVLSLLALLTITFVIAVFYLLSLIDDLKERIDRVVDDNRWQNEQIERLMERISKLEKK